MTAGPGPIGWSKLTAAGLSGLLLGWRSGGSSGARLVLSPVEGFLCGATLRASGERSAVYFILRAEAPLRICVRQLREGFHLCFS